MGAVQSVAGYKMLRQASALVLGLVLSAATLVGTPAVAAETTLRTPVKIMPMGDSISHGAGATGGYRLELKDLLVPAGHSFDFVGSQSSGPYEMEDRQHQGHSGYRIDQIADIARDKVTTYRPDIVLLVIGTNDVGQDYALASAPARLGGLIDTILDAAPAASVIVGSIPPFADPVEDAQVRTYNAAIPGVVQARADAGKKVSFVDMYPVLVPAASYLVDGVHPNADGYFEMAKVWRTALLDILPAVPPPGTPDCPCSAWSAGQAPVVSTGQLYLPDGSWRALPGGEVRPHHRDSFLQGSAEHRYTQGQPLGSRRSASCERDIHERIRVRLAAGEFQLSGRRMAVDDLCRLLFRTCGPLCGRSLVLHPDRDRQQPGTAASGGSKRRQWLVGRNQYRGIPEPAVIAGRELLGRRCFRSVDSGTTHPAAQRARKSSRDRDQHQFPDQSGLERRHRGDRVQSRAGSGRNNELDRDWNRAARQLGLH